MEPHFARTTPFGAWGLDFPEDLKSYLTRMPSNLGKERAPCLVWGNLIRNLGLQKWKKGPLRGLVKEFHDQGSSTVLCRA